MLKVIFISLFHNFLYSHSQNCIIRGTLLFAIAFFEVMCQNTSKTVGD